MTLIKQCKNWKTVEYNLMMAAAAEGGRIQIVEQCRAWGANDYYLMMLAAARHGHLEIVKSMKAEYKSTTLDK